MTHIVFKLPNGAGGAAAQYCAYKLTTQIKTWAEQHNIQVKHYNGAAYRLCFEFGRTSDYTLFALSWSGKEYELVESNI